MEDLRTATRLIAKGDFMCTLDLTDAYFSIPVHQDSRKYLRFSFKDRFYQFICLPFGLNISPYIFTKLLRPVMSLLRVQGLSSVIYLDDILLVAPSADLCRTNVLTTSELLSRLGFIINYRKSQLSPSKACRFLGFVLSSDPLQVSLPHEKKEHLLRSIKKLRNRSSCSIFKFARLLGRLVAACPGVAFGFVHTKQLEAIKLAALRASDWNFADRMLVSSDAKSELRWWINAIPTAVNSIKSDSYDLTIFSDASSDGWGASTELNSAYGFWSAEEREFHINQLELLAVFNGLRALASDVSSAQILLRVDNTTAISYINKMGGGTQASPRSHGSRHLGLGGTAKYFPVRLLHSFQGQRDRGSLITHKKRRYRMGLRAILV